MTQTRNRQWGTHPLAESEQVGETTARSVPRLTAGVTLRAADALLGDQQTFTREQVAYLLALAYDSGRTATYLADVAELHCAWQDNAAERKTYEQRVAERLAEMATVGGDYRGGPVEWETGRPVRRPEPYSSAANGTDLGVAERELFGRLAA